MDIRRATLAVVREMAVWADAEGWTPGLGDAAAFHAADPEGFFVAEVGGEMAACLSVVNHSAAFAFLGLYICRPDLRGRGIGYALWQAGLGHAGDRVVGLDGVAAQEANYARSGFVRSGATVRHEGPLAARPDPDIRPVAPDDLPDLMALDRAATGVDRPAFLRAWLTPTATRQAVCLPGGRGLAVIRRCGRGVKLGPVLAADAGAAADPGGALPDAGGAGHRRRARGGRAGRPAGGTRLRPHLRDRPDVSRTRPPGRRTAEGHRHDGAWLSSGTAQTEGQVSRLGASGGAAPRRLAAGQARRMPWSSTPASCG